ncbi:Uncharacterised protein [Burkholderia pseudomallei]|nr:Uncharacterised protein [Burkholderia pseudomallei]
MPLEQDFRPAVVQKADAAGLNFIDSPHARERYAERRGRAREVGVRQVLRVALPAGEHPVRLRAGDAVDDETRGRLQRLDGSLGLFVVKVRYVDRVAGAHEALLQQSDFRAVIVESKDVHASSLRRRRATLPRARYTNTASRTASAA